MHYVGKLLSISKHGNRKMVGIILNGFDDPQLPLTAAGDGDGGMHRTTTSKLGKAGKSSVVHCGLHDASSFTIMVSEADSATVVSFEPTPLAM
jgi:hypothetical protein